MSKLSWQEKKARINEMADMIKQMDNVGVEAGIDEIIVTGNIRDFAFMVQGFRKFALRFVGIDIDPYDLEEAVIRAIFNAAGIKFIDANPSAHEKVIDSYQ